MHYLPAKSKKKKKKKQKKDTIYCSALGNQQNWFAKYINKKHFLLSLNQSAKSVTSSFQEQRFIQRGEFHISHDASRQICLFSSRWKERSRVSREIFNDLNFKMQLIQGKF